MVAQKQQAKTRGAEERKQRAKEACGFLCERPGRSVCRTREDHNRASKEVPEASG